MSSRPGCFSGLGKLLLLDWLFDWLQKRFGFGRGCSCTGIGCVILILLIFLILTCTILTGTDWTSFRF
jgi:hypothetical protein